MLIEAFGTSVLWGLGYLFVPFVSLIWLVLHWDRGGKPFLISLAGGGLLIVGAMLSGNV